MDPDVDYHTQLLLLLHVLLQREFRRNRNMQLVLRRMRQQQRHRLLQPSSIFPLFTVILDCLSVREISIRRFWELPRPQNWFQLLLDRPDLDFWWREHFRVNRGTFTKIIEIARPHMQTEDSRFRRATSVEKKVAAALWRLANGHSYRTIWHNFRYGHVIGDEIYTRLL